MREIAAEPGLGLDAAIEAVPELAESRDAQEAILAATIEVWFAPGGTEDEFGAIDEPGWQASIDYMVELGGGLVPNPVTVEDLVDGSYLPAG